MAATERTNKRDRGRERAIGTKIDTAQVVGRENQVAFVGATSKQFRQQAAASLLASEVAVALAESWGRASELAS